MAKQQAAVAKRGKRQDLIKQALAEAMDAEAMAQAVIDGLKAMKFFQQDGKIVEAPDFLTRLKYLEFLRDTVEGTPVKRQEIIHGTAPDPEALRTKLEGSAAMRASLRRLLDDVEKRQASQEGVAAESSGTPEFVDI
ncbi:hypothetical protein [Cerasicoccus frondis]|uniref:hypothetical protein n=1 Tax=Cerasicoccus frondis TaxID=490090 RepID=UPI002852A474|nr:hypothetical protein [Cerasicoccus frondis]